MTGSSVTFTSRHEPGIPPGNYVMKARQVVKASHEVVDKSANRPDETLERTHAFTISGDRFEMPPQHVRAVFPPRESLGDHWNTLAHVVFHRTTLPWERVGNHDPNATGDARLPWLAVLLFDEDDPVPEVKTTTVQSLHDLALACTNDPLVSPRYHLPDPEVREFSHAPDKKVRVIDVTRGTLRRICPRADELRYLSHVRQWEGGNDTGELSVCVGTMLPRPKRVTTAHLVSVEARYRGKTLHDLEEGTDKEQPIRLVSLLSWRFTCRDEKQSFTGLLDHLNMSPATLRAPDAAAMSGVSAPVSARLQAGYVLMPFRSASGRQTAAWYRGPFVPAARETAPDLPLVHHARQLTRLDSATGLPDISLAAAWGLGRMMILKQRTIARALFDWKRRHVRAANDAASRLDHLPYRTLEGEPDLPKAVATWFRKLALLENVPFSYLVPDPEMVPVESLRTFCVDPQWVEALLNGAFSVGRLTRAEAGTEQALFRQHIEVPGETRSGVLVRSDAVAGWPDLRIIALATNKRSIEAVAPENELATLRHALLSDHVALGIFAGNLNSFDIAQKAEVMHFGFDKDVNEPEALDRLSKRRRRENGVEDQDGDAVPIKVMHKEPQRIDVVKMAWLLGAKTPSEFALQMIVGVERVRFT